MSDKANTKHGNMVALPAFFGTQTQNATNASLKITLYVVAAESTYERTAIAMPFSGAIVGLSYFGDTVSAGTLSVAVTLNGVPVEQTRLSVDSATCTVSVSSAQAVKFSAGDTIGVCHSGSANVSASVDGAIFAVPFVMFSNV